MNHQNKFLQSMDRSVVLFTFICFILSLLRQAAAVSPPPLFPKEALPTKSGYLPVNPNTNSAIFYTFYEAQNPLSEIPETPLLIWLQGGPGCSSMLGNFYELGPWRVTSHSGELKPNPGAWNRLFGLLFHDNPIGVGFSIAASEEEIPSNQIEVATHLYVAIEGFIKQNPGFDSRPVYITGESYAGKYVPAIGYYILKMKPKGSVNLKGLVIGDGLTDPITQVATHAENAYQFGLINQRQRENLEKAQEKTIEFVKTEKWREAVDSRTQVLKLLQNMTGLATLYDFSRKIPYKFDLVAELLNKAEAKRALGLNETLRYEVCSDVVEAAMHEDVMKSVKFMVEYLVEDTRVLLYTGQRDLQDGVVSTEAWIETMSWQGLSGYLAAERKIWRDKDGKLAGYIQKWSNLSRAVVLGAGHLVPADQAVNSQEMIENWVFGKGLFGNVESGGKLRTRLGKTHRALL